MSLGAALVLGAYLRFINLGHHSLWADELATAKVANADLDAGFWQLARNDVHPPGYYLLLNLWCRVFGDTEVSLRTPSVIAGVALIGLCYHLANKIWGRGAAHIAAWLSCVSPFFIHYSQEARSYQLLAAMATWCACCAYSLVSSASAPTTVRRIIAHALPFALAAYVHYTGLILALVLLGFVLLVEVTQRRDARPVLWTITAAVAMYAPWLKPLRNDLATGGLGFLDSPRFTELIAYPLRVLPFFAYVLFGAGAAGALYLTRRNGAWKASEFADADATKSPSEQARSRFALPLLLVWSLGFIGLIWLKSVLGRPIFNDRNLIAAMPGIIILLSGVARIIPRRLYAVAPVVGFSVGCLVCWHTYWVQGYTKNREVQAVRTAVKQGLALVEKSSKIPVITRAASPGRIDYYVRRFAKSRQVIANIKHLSRLKAAVKGKHALVIGYGKLPSASVQKKLNKRFRIVRDVKEKKAYALLLERRGAIPKQKKASKKRKRRRSPR